MGETEQFPIFDAEFIKSAPSLREAPDLEGLPEVVLLGRSNVGKSSFINSMIQRRNLAKTSNTPGKTRLINFYRFSVGSRDKKLVFVDLPGYGYAKVSKTEQEKWRKNLEGYLKGREPLRLAIQLIDLRHGPMESDFQMREWVSYHDLPVLTVLTKADKLSRNEQFKQKSLAANALELSSTELIVFSAPDNLGREEAWKRLLAQLNC